MRTQDNEFDGVRCNSIERRKFQDAGRRGTDQPAGGESQASELARLRNQNQALREELDAHVEIAASRDSRIKALEYELEQALRIIETEHGREYYAGQANARALLEEKP